MHWTHLEMMVRWLVFGEISGQLSCSLFPKHVLVAVVDYILYPIKPHIHSFGTFSVWNHLLSHPRWIYLSAWALSVVYGPFNQGLPLLIPLIWCCETIPPLLIILRMTLHFLLYWRVWGFPSWVILFHWNFYILIKMASFATFSYV